MLSRRFAQRSGYRKNGYRFSIERGGEFASLSFAMAENIESHLVEKRIFKPAKNFVKGARIKSLAQYRRMYRESIKRLLPSIG